MALPITEDLGAFSAALERDLAGGKFGPRPAEPYVEPTPPPTAESALLVRAREAAEGYERAQRENAELRRELAEGRFVLGLQMAEARPETPPGALQEAAARYAGAFEAAAKAREAEVTWLTRRLQATGEETASSRAQAEQMRAALAEAERRLAESRFVERLPAAPTPESAPEAVPPESVDLHWRTDLQGRPRGLELVAGGRRFFFEIVRDATGAPSALRLVPR